MTYTVFVFCKAQEKKRKSSVIHCNNDTYFLVLMILYKTQRDSEKRCLSKNDIIYINLVSMTIVFTHRKCRRRACWSYLVTRDWRSTVLFCSANRYVQIRHLCHNSSEKMAAALQGVCSYGLQKYFGHPSCACCCFGNGLI